MKSSVMNIILAFQELPEPDPDSPGEAFPEGEIVKPIEERDPHSISTQVPLYRAVFTMDEDLRFLRKTICCHHEELCINGIQLKRMLSEENSRPTNYPPFTVDHFGYKTCLQIRLDHDNVSISIAIMKGERDKQLVWPFGMVIIFRLKNLSGGHHREKMFRCDRNGYRLRECLSKPKGAMNAAMGYPQFVSRQSLLNNGFIRNNSMHLECYLFPRDAKLNHPSEVPSVIK